MKTMNMISRRSFPEGYRRSRCRIRTGPDRLRFLRLFCRSIQHCFQRCRFRCRRF